MSAAEHVDAAGRAPPDGHRYILITECLQNDLFLNRECRLFLGEQTAASLMVGSRSYRQAHPTGRLSFSDDAVAQGPLRLFLEAVVGRRRRGEDGRDTLHVINVRDWHVPGPTYDQERRTYGSHCEKGTWGAGYLDGLESYLDPRGAPADEEALFFSEGSVCVYHVHSDSVFDFRPRLDDGTPSEGKLARTHLEDILDILVQGSDEDVAKATATLTERPHDLDAIHEMARRIDEGPPRGIPVYIAVIGVYSDVKILTLIGGINARYSVPNLSLSDTLSGSATLERHIAGLDFAHKVMNVEILHGVNDLVRYLGGTPPLEDETKVIPPDDFARYQSYFKDKQGVLAYESEKLQDYLRLTEKRALNTFEWVRRANLFLILWGSIFLLATLVLSIVAAVDSSVDWKVPAITGGLSLIQLVTAFFTSPMRDLSRNVTNLATYRMVLESHSLKMAFARFHLTTPYTLREVKTQEEAAEATRQIEVLRSALGAIDALEGDYGVLKDLGFGTDQAAPAVAPAAGNGAGPAPAGDEAPTVPDGDGAARPRTPATPAD
jgi:hypothetical protein